MHLTLIFIFGIFLHNTFSTTESRKVTPDGTVHEGFKGDAFRRITSHLIETNLTNTLGLCALNCVKNLECVSFNFGNAFKGKHVCELLRTDKYNSRSSYVNSTDYHYFYPENKCMNPSPCQNNGLCYPDYDNEDYYCVCHRAKGRNCETADLRGPDNSTILLDYGNVSYVQTLSSYLDPVLQDRSKSRWIRCWHAASDGWNVTTTFHPQCDNKGPTVTIVRVGKNVFGGYSDVAWDSGHGWSWSNRPFLYSLYNINGYQPVKLTLKENGFVIRRVSSYGPTFGRGHDLYISNLASSYKKSYTVPFTYNPPPGCKLRLACTFFAGTSSFTPNDVEVFYETTS